MNRNVLYRLLGKLESLEQLGKEASFIKHNVYGNTIFLRGIIEFSNVCRKNCFYCGIRKGNKIIKRYRMGMDEILKRVENIVANGIKTVVLQSGEDVFYTKELLCKIIRNIKRNYNVAITLCIGERTEDEYKAFRDAGADRFLMKHETSNHRVYEMFHPGETLTNRLKLLEKLKKLGYQVGSGNIIGLPYTSMNDYINDILLIKSLDLDMAGLGPFMPTKNTPLEHFPPPNIEVVLKIIGLARIILEDVNIPATTALFSLGGIDAVSNALDMGANVLMPNFTGDEYRKDYNIYDNKKPLNLETIKGIIEEKGLAIVESKGERIKYGRNNEIRKKKSYLCWQN